MLDFIIWSQTSPLREGQSLRFDGTIDTMRVDDAIGKYGVIGQLSIILRVGRMDESFYGK